MKLKGSLLFDILIVAVFVLIAGTSHYLYTSENLTNEDITEVIQNEITRNIEQVEQQLFDLPDLNNLKVDNYRKALKSVSNAFVFDNGRLIYWSNTSIIPTYKNISGIYSTKFIRTVRRDFIAVKKIFDKKELVVIIPLHQNYRIENRYFKTRYNEDIFPTQNINLIQVDNAQYKICYKEECLFGIEYQENTNVKKQNWAKVALMSFVIGLLILFRVIYKYSTSLFKESILKRFVTLVSSLFLVRYILLELELPNRLSESFIFDSRVFASSVMNASFGDLILNLIILCIISWFLIDNLFISKAYRKVISAGGLKRSAFGILGITCFLFVFHWLYLFLQTLYHNSQISFDINDSIIFDSIRLTALFAYLLFTFLILILLHVSIRSSIRLVKSSGKMWIYGGLASSFFALINLLFDQKFLLSLSIAAILFIILYVGNLPKSLNKLSYGSLLYLFVLMIGLSIIGSGAIYKFENEREVEKKIRFANQFLIDNDHMAEYLLSSVNNEIKNDIFIKTRMASPFLSKDVVESKIRQVYLNDYFDRYDIKISMYDTQGQSFIENPSKEEQLKKLDMSEYKTGYDGIYFINLQERGFTKRYLDYIEVKRRGINVGYIVLDLRLKKIIPENVYPELLVDNRYLSPYQNENYSYAVFDSLSVVYSSGDFNYNQDFITRFNTGSSESFEYAGFKHVVARDLKGHKIVVSSNGHPRTDVISNFSFLFLIKVFVLLLVTFIYALVIWTRRAQLTYSARIQLYLNIAFFLPLFAVSITTLSMINASFEKEVVDEYYKKAEDVGNNISSVLSDFVNDITDEEELTESVLDIARYSNTDINVFNTNGRLIATNQPAIYENELLSDYVNNKAYQRIVLNGDKSFTTKEQVGELKFNTAYYGVKSFETGNLVGLVSIPFFDSESALQESQIIVITNIINVFTIVFIAFLVISYFATEWLTFPLNFITQKLKRTTLTEFNEPLVWNSDDEIGMMVGEYNRMLINLEESKRALARSEKQSAWREIAQQVAHEIKNPLTPMKLTLQHLSRTLSDKGNNDQKLKPINSLLKQIETLDDIASSFSSFAKMPIPESEKYELTTLISHTVNLHQSAENLELNLQMPSQKVYTTGDEQLMGRIVSNLIINAIQSINKELRILHVKLTILKTKAVLSVSDNGSGIDEDIQQKIFIPNFTTKEAGSGIGLAIAKHGIEHAGGKIWFETVKGEGTTFFVELPIVNE